MPIDRNEAQEIEEEAEEEAKKSGRAAGSKRRFEEFDCPTCSANTPVEFRNNDEISCAYCGLSFLVLVDGEGTLKLREL